MRAPRLCVLSLCALLVGPAGAARAVTVDVALELTEYGNNYDDPCFWQDPTDPGAALACVTSKDDGQVECFALPSGDFVGLATGFSGEANNCEVDQARNEMVTTDNGGDRVLVHRLPGVGQPVRVLEDSEFSTVTGICVAHTGGRSLVYVTDESTKKVYALDSVTGQRVTSFSHGLSKAEGIACDDGLQRVVVCDDQSDSRGCRAFTFGGAPVGQEFGIPQTRSDSEGVTVYECGPTDGYIIVSDQSENEFEVFDRQPPFTHYCTFELQAGGDVTDDTDGIDVVQIPAYPNGLFGACDGCSGSTDELDLARWEDIASACGLQVCPLGEAPGETGPICGDGVVNQPSEACDRDDDAACPGRCAVDCTCLPTAPGSPICGDNQVNRPAEACDGTDDTLCPGQCQADCTCPGAGGETADATVVADASTMSSSSNRNFNDDELSVDAGSAKHTFLRIRVDGVDGRLVTQALLHLRVDSSSSAESDHGGRIHPAPCGWDEARITWDNEPAIDPLVVDEHPGNVEPGDVVTFDLTGYLDRDGEHCFAMTSPSNDSVRYASRETSDGPTVDVLVGGQAAPGSPVCGDGLVNRAVEDCDGIDDAACPGACQSDCSCPTGSGQVVATVVADATTRQRVGDRNYNGDLLMADRRSPKQSFLRIRVSGTGGRRVSRALLHLRAEEARRGRSNHGGVIQVTSCDWAEDTITWDTQPQVVPPVIAAHGDRVAPGEVVTFDLTHHLTRDGDYCFSLGTPSADAVRYYSRETEDGPLVDLTLAGSPTPQSATCGDSLVNQASEECDGTDDAACPGLCESDCTCGAGSVPGGAPRCGDDSVNRAGEECDGTDAALCPGACRANCSCPAPPAPPAAPSDDEDTFACLAGGADIVLRGTIDERYGNRDLSPGTVIDATEATFIHCSQPDPSAPCRENIYPITVGPISGSGVCWAGGIVEGANRLDASWSEMHDPNNAGFAFENASFTVDGVRIHNTGDGIRPRGGAENFVIKNVWVSHVRDDCVENDHMNGGLIDDSLFDGCYRGFSSRHSDPSERGPDNVVTIQNTLVRLEAMPFPSDGGDLGHKTFFKINDWGDPNGQSPQFALYNNIFMAEQAGDTSEEKMGLPPGKIAGCANNIMVWLGPGDYPADLPDCFTVVKDASVWENARADWIARHPEIPSLGQ